MKTNNVQNEIKDFLKNYCIKIKEVESYEDVEEMLDNHKCIDYQGDLYYIPDDCSLMSEDDHLLKQMLLATFYYE